MEWKPYNIVFKLLVLFLKTMYIINQSEQKQKKQRLMVMVMVMELFEFHQRLSF